MSNKETMTLEKDDSSNTINNNKMISEAMSSLNNNNKNKPKTATETVKLSVEDEESNQKKLEALKAVKINKVDVEIICRELEVDTLRAENALRENDGNIISALKYLIHSK
ncbi:hypothetical protein DFA_06900 [Cavenderia fasciculata]|uniref:Nascent polypeptide-associated complex subunit alpha-like UBA domain-containing protein n=1 Tax=Cavenderia fasciculata TaxID=261658 RepID=F4PWZ5_CACFS|nr:uncharacterized protein DFA_06900 [Cavenderia fasciculata]EGG19798.1 hypothetical protein DFA_06900 [Cavenderia fasciculata]|eukprot:XP_004358144.1 hypothetical protein DFA_06900 [Cavenderia fasciculata]